MDGIECWEEAEPATFMVRGLNYMQDKKKVPSEDSIYRQVRHIHAPLYPSLALDRQTGPRRQHDCYGRLSRRLCGAAQVAGV